VSDQANGNGNARWQTVASFATIGVIPITGLIGMFVQLTRLSSASDNLSFRITAAEAGLNSAQDRLAENRAQLAKINADLREVETQLCAEDSLRNHTVAWDNRVFAMLWSKTFSMVLPTDNPYYGQVGQCATPGR
jgi:hypothetical protein